MKIRNCFFWVFAFALTACEQSATVQSGLAETPAEESAEQASGDNLVVMGRTHQVQSSVYETEKTLTVRLPGEYEASPDKKYPVIYLIDGGAEQDFPHIAGLAQYSEIVGAVEPFILIGIETENRRSELTPPSDDVRYDESFEERGGSEKFRQYIREDIMPWVEERYRNSPERVVMGESLAGLFITETMLRDPSLFTSYVAVSPSLWWDDLRLVRDAPALLANFTDLPLRAYFTMGNEGWAMQDGLDHLIAALQTAQLPQLEWSYVDRRNSEEHGSIYHLAALDALRTFFLTPHRTGTSSAAFYVFPDGVAPPLSDRAKENVELECTRENAVLTTFEEVNADPVAWRGMCVLMKPGPQPEEVIGGPN